MTNPEYCLREGLGIRSFKVNNMKGGGVENSRAWLIVLCMSIEHQDCRYSRSVYSVDWSTSDVLFSDTCPKPTAHWRIDRCAYAISIPRHGPGDKMREFSLHKSFLYLPWIDHHKVSAPKPCCYFCTGVCHNSILRTCSTIPYGVRSTGWEY